MPISFDLEDLRVKHNCVNYFENMNCSNVIFKYIEYDISKCYEYDYSTFRPNIKIFLSDLLL